MSEQSIYTNELAEKALIGIALNSSAKQPVIARASGSIFYFDASKKAHQGIENLFLEKTPVDLVQLNSWLETHYPEDKWLDFLTECMDVGYMDTMAEQYLGILEECANRRALLEVGQDLIKRSASEEPDKAREWAAGRIAEIKTGKLAEATDIESAFTMAFDEIHNYMSQGTDTAILSGIESLDSRIGSLKPGMYVAIGARPGVGKSALAMTYCMNTAMRGKRVLVVSLEMSPAQLIHRVMADKADVPLNRITSGSLSNTDFQRLGTLTGDMLGRKVPITISTGANTAEKIRNQAYYLFEHGGLDLIAVDYLQLMDTTGSGSRNRNEQICEISRKLKLLAMELKVPILVLSQLNRSSVGADGKMREPTMADARDSGAIEQDADLFILLHNPDESEMRTEEEKIAFDRLKAIGQTMVRLIVDKNRQGKRGKITLAFDGDHMRYKTAWGVDS